MMLALITKRKSPNVKIVAGNVSNISRGFTIASSSDSTTATTMAVKKSTMVMPGKIYSRIKTFTEQTNTLISHFFILPFLVAGIQSDYNYFVKLFRI